MDCRRLTPRWAEIIFDYLLYGKDDYKEDKLVTYVDLAQKVRANNDFFDFLLDNALRLNTESQKIIAPALAEILLYYGSPYVFPHKFNDTYIEIDRIREFMNPDSISEIDLVKKRWLMLRDRPDEYFKKLFEEYEASQNTDALQDPIHSEMSNN